MRMEFNWTNKYANGIMTMEFTWNIKMNDTLMEFAWAKLSLPSILFVTIGNVKLIEKSDMCQPKINGIMTIVIYLGKISVAPNSGSDNGECVPRPTLENRDHCSCLTRNLFDNIDKIYLIGTEEIHLMIPKKYISRYRRNIFDDTKEIHLIRLTKYIWYY